MSTVPVMLKVNVFFDGGRRSFILIWIVIGTEGARKVCSYSDVRPKPLTLDDGVSEVIVDGVTEDVGVEFSKEYSSGRPWGKGALKRDAEEVEELWDTVR